MLKKYPLDPGKNIILDAEKIPGAETTPLDAGKVVGTGKLPFTAWQASKKKY